MSLASIKLTHRPRGQFIFYILFSATHTRVTKGHFKGYIPTSHPQETNPLRGDNMSTHKDKIVAKDETVVRDKPVLKKEVVHEHPKVVHHEHHVQPVVEVTERHIQPIHKVEVSTERPVIHKVLLPPPPRF